MHDVSFQAMGSAVRLLVDGPGSDAVARRERAFVEDCAKRLSRFDPRSELSALNRDPREEVPASPLLRAAVGAGLWAAGRSGGLVDPTLVDQIEEAGYEESRIGATPASLAAALAAAPAREPARPQPGAAWSRVVVDDRAGAIRRPRGVRIDTGGTAKGLVADAVAHRLARHGRVAVDCGGDIALRGDWEIDVQHPLTHEVTHRLRVSGGGVATSGLDVRIWRRADGGYAHHLLDPASGEPAWTGLVGATAVGGSALEAETLSKLALLSGPDGARRVLAERGGVLFHEDGSFEAVAA